MLSIFCKQVSKSKCLIIVITVVFLVVLITGIILLILACIKPCWLTRCHPKASRCINRWPFKAQCICSEDTTGNGRTVCDECGVKYDFPNARIIGGENVTVNSWPFSALIRQHYQKLVFINGEFRVISPTWMCGGTLINRRTILTASHCLKTAGDTFEYESFEYTILWNEFYPNIESVKVSVGVYDRRKQTRQQHVKVIQVIRHPLFDEKNLHNDIALLKLADDLRPSRTIQFACLANSYLDVNLTGIAVGFGDTIPGANQGSIFLQQVNLTIYPNEYCSNVASSIVKNWTMQLCCGDLQGERDVCHGDSGGGLFIQRNVSDANRYTVDGIVSYGEECATPMKPSIYTRISNYIDWIGENSDF
ncbi:unnamed protein product [Adineta ricciae]|uniref:Peptidase S1 domain-containing protein n=1 Tax=Adineta ricciae TaxID=249248 RepID=A0A815UKL5_ADIRI|nr:unnamed protein product [Adineta ricciae]CAF1520736.1 unnamed protein product [Adineta ricciae]